ncbi:MAG: Brp/Blh family beta-carotene 15,15'-dioxygenase [Flavobacteriaceae bacterium]|nr:Brp/Blh family beta-carotene 15,15'-dioxygenase [Flavobacteriaceae bacterium]
MLRISQSSGEKLFTFIIISAIAYNFINSMFSEAIGYVSVLSILFFGIIHGANDIHLILKRQSKNSGYIKVTFYYILVILLATLGFYSFPGISLLFFVLFSCYHFGEQQWTVINKSFDNKIYFFSYGLFVFSLLFYFNIEAVIDIISKISNLELLYEYFEYLFYFSSIILTFTTLIYFNELKDQLIFQILLFIIMIFSFKSFDLIDAFAFYFVLYHSIPSIFEQTEYLFGEISFESILKYFKSALLYWVFAIVGLIIYYYLNQANELSLNLFFSFLAAITFPHVIVILKMKKN